jgi:hypothetical protein
MFGYDTVRVVVLFWLSVGCLCGRDLWIWWVVYVVVLCWLSVRCYVVVPFGFRWVGYLLRCSCGLVIYCFVFGLLGCGDNAVV